MMINVGNSQCHMFTTHFPGNGKFIPPITMVMTGMVNMALVFPHYSESPRFTKRRCLRGDFAARLTVQMVEHLWSSTSAAFDTDGDETMGKSSRKKQKS